MTEQEARERVIRAMCPQRVCRTCGEPSRRLVAALDNQRRQIAAIIIARREAMGLRRRDLLPLFVGHYKNEDSVLAQISNWELAKNVPVPHDWQLLKGRLGIESDEFDDLIAAESRWNDAEYVPQSGPGKGTGHLPAMVNPAGRGFKWHEADRTTPTGFTDCGHDDWRPGLVLDPFNPETTK